VPGPLQAGPPEASFSDLLVSNAEHIAAAVSRRFASGAQSTFVLRSMDF
jgi:hypothetical protein